MPIYEYRCENGHNFEVMQSITADPLTECTECGAPVQKVLHSPAIHFKGSGFHNTDYGTRKANKAKAAADDAKGGNGSSGSSDSGSSASSGSDSSSSSSGSGDSGTKASSSTSSSD